MAEIPQDTLPAHLPYVPAPSAPNSVLPTQVQVHPFKWMHSPKAEMDKELNKHLQVNKQVIGRSPFAGDASRQVISCRQEGHILAKCPQKDERTKGLVYHNHKQDNHKLQWTHGSLIQTTSAFTVVVITDQLFAPHGLNLNQPQVL